MGLDVNANYVIISVFTTKKNMLKKEKHQFMSKMYSDDDYTTQKVKNGLLIKFNNSLGFKDLEWQKEFYHIHEPKIESPDGYQTPYGNLLVNMYYLNRVDELVTFILPNKRFVHPNGFNYTTLGLAVKFQSFLYKIYKNHIRIEIEFENNVNLSLKDKVLSYFYCVTAEGEHYDTEITLPRRLKEKEKEYILKNIKECVSYHPVITQYACEEDDINGIPKEFYIAELRSYEKVVEERNECIGYGYIPGEEYWDL